MEGSFCVWETKEVPGMSIVAGAGVGGVGDANPVRLFGPAPSEFRTNTKA
jgi:hypothetical protein